MTDYSDLRKQLLNEIASDSDFNRQASLINKKLMTGEATFSDASKLADKLARVTAKKLKANLPELEFGAYGETVVAPIYTEIQKTILHFSRKIQKEMLQKAKLGVNPAEVKPDASRVKHIVGRFREAESVDTVSFLVGDGVSENIARAAVTDSIKANAWQLTNMGFETYVVRSDGAGCCDWCASKAGTYRVGALLDDFWAVHKDCSCTFDYITKDTHQRISFSTDENGKLVKETKNI